MYELNVLKSTEPDGFHPGVLKGIMDVIAGPLSIIHQPRSLESGRVPADWKPANVVSVYKNGIRENYRPVAFFFKNYGDIIQVLLKGI